MRFLLTIIFLILTAYNTILTKKLWTEIKIPVRDSILLNADLYAMDTTKAKPVILIQTPYNKAYFRYIRFVPDTSAIAIALFDTISYNYVVMDWRGFYSNKDFSKTGYNRGFDGYDAIEWIAKQKWCNGKIGTEGSSALGQIQFLTAAEHPPHLVCSAPFVKDYLTKYSDYYYGGVLRKEHVEGLQALGFFTVNQIIDHPIYNNFWKAAEKLTDLSEKIKIPLLIVTGWFDHFPSAVIRAFNDLVQNSDEKVREQHKLIVGPWLHGSLGLLHQGDLEYPNAVDIPLIAKKDFFAYYLQGAKNGWILKPKVRYFQMGDNKWYIADNLFELNNMITDTLYLQRGGLIKDTPPPPIMPPMNFPPDTIIFNPRNPSPSIGGARFQPFDKNIEDGPLDISQSVESRNDVLVFSTETLKKDITIKGKIQFELFISSDRKDTDFAIRLCDVYPDGKSYIIRQCIKRARFWKTLNEEHFLEKDSIYKITLELDYLAITFVKGHKLRIDISSSDYPMFDLNPNSGGQLYKPSDTLIATNLVYSNSDYPSRIIFSTPEPLSVNDFNNTCNISFEIYPNPLTSDEIINININIKKNANVKIDLCNSLGLIVGKTYHNYFDVGSHTIQYTPEANLPSGTYWLRMIINNKETIVKPAVIVR